MQITTRATWLALGLGCASLSCAQGSVQLYGRINTSIDDIRQGDVHLRGLHSNQSFLGFKGEEDLGNGLRTGFVLESLFAADSGSGEQLLGQRSDSINFAHHSALYLRSNWGLLRMGAFDPYSYTITGRAISDWMNNDAGYASDALYPRDEKRANVLAYRTPLLPGGLTAEIQHRFGEKTVNRSSMDKGGWDLGLNWQQGPWGAGLGYQRSRSDTLFTPALGSMVIQSKPQLWSLRGSYEAQNWRVGAYWLHYKARSSVHQTSDPQWQFMNQTLRRNTVRLAAMYRDGASEWNISVGHASKIKRNGQADRYASTQGALAYRYHLSPRTSVYTYYSTLKEADFIAHGRWYLDAGALSGAHSIRAIGAGIRHTF